MEIIKALALHPSAVRVDGSDLYVDVSLHDFRTDASQPFGVQVARSATVTFSDERMFSHFVSDCNIKSKIEKMAVLTLKGEIRNVEKAIVAFLGTKIIDELLNL